MDRAGSFDYQDVVTMAKSYPEIVLKLHWEGFEEGSILTSPLNIIDEVEGGVYTAEQFDTACCCIAVNEWSHDERYRCAC